MNGVLRGEVALEVLDSLIEGCQVIGFDYRYLYANDSVARQGGRSREELIGRTMMECYPGIDASAMFQELQRCMRDRVHHRMENEFTFPDGSVGWFDLRFIPVPKGVCILSADTTENKKAQAALARSEEQLHHAQKMEAIGRLASGVSHDFNNILSVIVSYATLARQSVEPESQLDADLQEIEKAASRATTLIRQLLAFSRKQALESRVLDLNEVISRIETMMRRAIGAEIALDIRRAPSLGMIVGDPGRVEQILLNLAVNARDAMPDGGTLSIETASVDLDEAYAREHLGTAPGPHVMLAVSDTGIGMDAETQAHIFEPFYTTKQPGQGTGLGLSTVFGIVQQYGGSIWVYSEPGNGTTFKVYFPVVQHADGSTPGETSAAASDALSNRERTILIAEDNERLRRTITDLLAHEQYSILVASTAEEAIRASDEFPGHLDLLLTDVTMPGMDGHELARRLRVARPSLRVVIMSGHAEGVVMGDRGPAHADAFLGKPITPTALSRVVRSVLDRT